MPESAAKPLDYEALLKQAQEELAQERKKTQPTTFTEFIRDCHVYLSQPIRV